MLHHIYMGLCQEWLAEVAGDFASGTYPGLDMKRTVQVSKGTYRISSDLDRSAPDRVIPELVGGKRSPPVGESTLTVSDAPILSSKRIEKV